MPDFLVHADYPQWRALLAPERMPCCICDLDAFDANLDTLLRALGDHLTLRIATKSVRVPALLQHILERGGERVQGLMTSSAHETALLAELGFDDLLCAYPLSRPDEAATLARLTAEGRLVVAVVDDPFHLRLLGEAAREAGVELPVCIDLDASWRPTEGLHLGVRRSPLRSSEAARSLAREVADTDGLRLEGLMSYEAQIAGLPDVHPHSRLLDPVRRTIKARSAPVVAERRVATVQTLRDDGHVLHLVNGGGTGSVRSTSDDPSVTEVTVGSGFLCPTLFDGYRDLNLVPAAFFALSVARSSDPDHITCLGGGPMASGPVGADRAPVAVAPRGLEPTSTEGWGEVQTPFKVTEPDMKPMIGDPVVCRPAKSGELMERHNEVLLVRGDRVEARVPTYRGVGGAFL